MTDVSIIAHLKIHSALHDIGHPTESEMTIKAETINGRGKSCTRAMIRQPGDAIHLTALKWTSSWLLTTYCSKQVTVRTPKGSVCRFFKPEQVQPDSTYIDKDLKIRLHRPIGCEYVNAYSPVVMAALKCNHDAQIVLDSTAKGAGAYVIKYCMKNQNPIENQAAFSLAAFAKAAAKTNSLPSEATLLERGYKILGSMLYSVTNGQEVAAPMAALFILRESPCWFSHDFMHVNLGLLLKKPADSVQITVPHEMCSGNNLQSSVVQSENLLEKYWRRQSSLEGVSFIQICEQYAQCGSTQRLAYSGASRPFSQVTFSKVPHPKVLVICGKEIPDIATHHDPESTEYYYRAMLTLFKPHRQSNLMCQNQTPLAAYRESLHCGDAVHVLQLEGYEAKWRDFYKSQTDSTKASNESEEAQLLRTRNSASSPWCEPSVGEGPTDDGGEDLDENIPDDFFDFTNVTAPNVSTDKLVTDATTTVDVVPNLRETVGAIATQYGAANALVLEPEFSTQNYPSRIVVPEIGTSEDDTMGTHYFIKTFPGAQTRLERLEECFGPVEWIPPTPRPRWTPDTLPPFPKIAVVSEAFRLNMWQHVMFETTARHLLYAYSQDIGDALDEPLYPSNHNRAPYQVSSQLRAYFGGEAGTGKSTVVHALLKFAKLWGRNGSVETMAFTGVAAINIAGKTIHSARNLRFNGAEPNSPPTLDMKSKFSRVVLVIVDEISITDQALLGGMDSVSRRMSPRPTEFMGGKHFILIGDFFQLPPIGGSPCFQTPPSEGHRLRHAGYALYQSLNLAIFLTENMRARTDPVYTEILDNLRWGDLTDCQLGSLNSRVSATTNNSFRRNDSRQQKEFFRPVVVSTNKLRCAINTEMMFQIARSHGVPIFECLAVPTARSRKLMDRIANATDNLTERIPMKLLFYIGMPIMITRKHPDLIDAGVIANGTMGTVVGIHPPPSSLSHSTAELDGVLVKKFISRPDLLLIKINNCDKPLIEGLPDGVIGLPPVSAQVKLSKLGNLGQSSVKLEQFAVVPAFACTTEKLQGQTCHDGIVVTPLDRRKAVPQQTLYVALSRSISLNSVTLTAPITREYLAKFKPTEATANEMSRLIQLVVLPPYISESEKNRFNQWRARQHIA